MWHNLRFSFQNQFTKMLERIMLFWSKTNRWHRVVALFVLAELSLIPGGRIGFVCNDPALSHAYTGDTVNWKWILSISAFLPLVVMLIVERQSKGEKARQQALYWFKEYFYGLLMNLTTVQVLKQLVGSPRPHFFDTCRPYEANTCQESEYVSRYTCTEAHWLSQSDKSFPSGHTSLAVHCAAFIAYYLWARCERHGCSRVRWAQLVSAVGALLCSASRVWDRRHHWWDVLAGALIGAAFLLYTIYLCNNFECSHSVSGDGMRDDREVAVPAPRPAPPRTRDFPPAVNSSS